MYVFAEPVSEETAEEIQNSGRATMKEFERNVIGVRRDDPEVQQKWQEIQDRVDEDVDEDQSNALKNNDDDDDDDDDMVKRHAEGRGDLEEDNTESESHLEDDPVSIGSEGAEEKKTDQPAMAEEGGPLTGWTLTIRNQVNGKYVERPTDLTPQDSWSLEYYIQEIPDAKKWKVYTALKKRRKSQLDRAEEEQSNQLKAYRQMLQTYSDKGREWREKQDKIDEQLGKRVYRPLNLEDVRFMPAQEISVREGKGDTQS
jgi:hypothetical protein